MNGLRQFGRHFIIRESLPLSRTLPFLVFVPLVTFGWRLLRGGTMAEATVSAAILLFLYATLFGTLEAVIRYKNRPPLTK